MSGPTADEPIDAEPIDAEVVEAEVVEAEAVEPGAPVAPVAPASDYDERGVPSFDYVRDRIEGRAALAQGTTELTGESARSRTLDEQIADRDAKAAEKLAELRRSLGLG